MKANQILFQVALTATTSLLSISVFGLTIFGLTMQKATAGICFSPSGRAYSCTPRSANRFLIVSPGPEVLQDRPELSWVPVAGANQYVISIFDEEEVEPSKVATVAASDLIPSQGGYVQIPYPFPEALTVGKPYQLQIEAQSDAVNQPEPIVAKIFFQVTADQ